ncbi:hypothetical protein ACROYT_G022508 [Oculina patagonica]
MIPEMFESAIRSIFLCCALMSQLSQASPLPNIKDKIMNDTILAAISLGELMKETKAVHRMVANKDARLRNLERNFKDISHTLKEFQKDATGFHSELKNTTSRHAQQLRYIQDTTKNTTNELTKLRDEYKALRANGSDHNRRLKDLEKKVQKINNALIEFKNEATGIHNGLKNKDSTQDSRLGSLEANYQDLSRRISSLQTGLTSLTNKVHSARVHCYDKNTAWEPRSDATIMFLDRQDVSCPSPYFLARFVLGREGDYNSARVRYHYRCCRFIL